MAQYLRLRQICLVARDLEPTLDDLATVFGLEECYRDPMVAKYGLVNALLPVGTSFLEVVSPTRPGTAAGRYLERKGGDAGYIVICDCDDNSVYRTRAVAAGIRIIEDHTYEGRAHLLQLHPRDTGGCILEFDHHIGGEALDGVYQWAGPDWRRHVRDARVAGITGVVVVSEAPRALAERWAGLCGRVLQGDARPGIALDLDNARIAFAAQTSGNGDALAGVHLRARDPGAIVETARARGLEVAADASSVSICGTQFHLQPA